MENKSNQGEPSPMIIVIEMKMRTLALVVIILAAFSGGFAQTSASLLGNESLLPRWYYYGYNEFGHTLFSESYYFGDTYIKNGKPYRELLFERAFFDGSAASSSSGIEGQPDFNSDVFSSGCIGVRESDGCIFVDRNEYMALLAASSYWSWEGNLDKLPYEETDDGELVIYDFTKKPGDRFVSKTGHEDIKVLSVELLTTSDGVNRRLQRLNNGCVVVEGIGCINSPGMWLCYLNPASSPCKKAVLKEFSIGENYGNTVFTYENIENSITDYGYILPVACFNLTECYNLQGQRLIGNHQKGVYIRQGRKMIKKD